MIAFNQEHARHWILRVAGIYILALGLIEGARHFGLLDPQAANEGLEQITTVASLTVGAVIGVHLATRRNES